MLRREEEKLLGFDRSPFYHLTNLLCLCGGFWGIFVAFNATQSLESSLNKELGYWSISSLYAAFCFGSLLVAPYFVAVFHHKISLIVGALTYVGFMIANLWPSYLTLIPTAVSLGIGASIIWTAQGAYLTACGVNYATTKNQDIRSAMGTFNGIFFAIFQTSQLVGNVISGVVLMNYGENSETLLFYIFIAIAGGGAFVFIFLREEDSVFQDTKETAGTIRRLFGVMLLWKKPKMFCLILLIFYNGAEMGFIFGDFTSFLIEDTIGKEWIGFVIAFFGFCDAISSILFGKLADHGKRMLVLLIGFVIHLGFFLFWIYFLHFYGKDYLEGLEWKATLFIAAGVYGIGDSIFNTLPAIFMSVFFTDNTEPAFSNLKLWQSLGFSMAFFLGPILDFNVKLIILPSLLTLAVISVLILHFAFGFSINKQTSQEDINGEY